MAEAFLPLLVNTLIYPQLRVLRRLKQWGLGRGLSDSSGMGSESLSMFKREIGDEDWDVHGWL